MKAKVAKNLRGTIVLPAIRLRAFCAGDEFELNNTQFQTHDIQKAIRDKKISIVGTSPKSQKMVTVSNIGTSSVILPESGVLRSNKSRDIPAELINHQEVRRLLKENKLIKGTIDDPEEEEKDLPQKKMSAVAYKPKGVDIKPLPTDLRKKGEKAVQKKVAKKENDKKIKRRHTGGDGEALIIDTIENGVEPVDDDDGITFVDVEQSRARISQHPNLRNPK